MFQFATGIALLTLALAAPAQCAEVRIPFRAVAGGEEAACRERIQLQ